MERAPGNRHETEHERLDRQLMELLQGFRVAVTGVQVLFAFLLTVPFAVGFRDVDRTGRALFYVALFGAALASICFTAPVIQHRILFRLNQKPLLSRRAALRAQDRDDGAVHEVVAGSDRRQESPR
jgi:hypothetical protein